MSISTVAYVLMALAVGALGGIHIPINGALGHRIQSALFATLAFYGIAFLLISVVCLFLWDARAFVALRSANPFYFTAGIISVIVVGGSTYLIPRIGALNLFVLLFSAQMIVRIFISHFGLLESPVSPISLVKIGGGVLLIIGAVMMIKG